MGVQALHTPPGAAHAARGTRTAMTGGQGGVALGRVALVGGRQRGRVDRGFAGG